MARVCATPGCGGPIPKSAGRSAPRKYCLGCRPRRDRPNRSHVVNLPASKPDTKPRGLVATYRRRLESAGRLDLPEGEHVMLLAEMLAAGGHTASGAASLSRELRAAMDSALEGAPKVADDIDELTARRERKASGA